MKTVWSFAACIAIGVLVLVAIANVVPLLVWLGTTDLSGVVIFFLITLIYIVIFSIVRFLFRLCTYQSAKRKEGKTFRELCGESWGGLKNNNLVFIYTILMALITSAIAIENPGGPLLNGALGNLSSNVLPKPAQDELSEDNSMFWEGCYDSDDPDEKEFACDHKKVKAVAVTVPETPVKTWFLWKVAVVYWLFSPFALVISFRDEFFHACREAYIKLREGLAERRKNRAEKPPDPPKTSPPPPQTQPVPPASPAATVTATAPPGGTATATINQAPAPAKDNNAYLKTGLIALAMDVGLAFLEHFSRRIAMKQGWRTV